MQINIGAEIRIIDPLLPRALVDEAAEMSKIFPVIYLFENSVRNLVKIVLENKYGDGWWDSKVSTKTKDKVDDRLKQEDANRWHGKRGVHKIFYTDIEDLKSIIISNWEDFKAIFRNQAWVQSKIEEIELSRNIIAHNNPLSDRDIKRLRINFEDWIRQISKFEKIKNSLHD